MTQLNLDEEHSELVRVALCTLLNKEQEITSHPGPVRDQQVMNESVRNIEMIHELMAELNK